MTEHNTAHDYAAQRCIDLMLRFLGVKEEFVIPHYVPLGATFVLFPEQAAPELCTLIRSEHIVVQYVEHHPSGGSSHDGWIMMRKGLGAIEDFYTLAHEFAHERLHHDGTPLSKTVKETEAETVAYIVTAAIGFDHSLLAAAYIRRHDGNVLTLRTSYTRIVDVAAQIIAHLTRQQHPRVSLVHRLRQLVRSSRVSGRRSSHHGRSSY